MNTKMPWEADEDPTDPHFLGLKAQKLNDELLEQVNDRRKRIVAGNCNAGDAERELQSDSLGRFRT